MKAFYVALMAVAGVAISGQAAADEALAKAKNCLTCHQVAMKIVGPSYKDIAAKYKGKADAEATLVKHLMSSPKVKLADGSEEEHKVVKTTPANDKAQVTNLVKYILSL
jgi:cytochrome c